MATEKDKLLRARSIINSIIEKQNPYTNEEIVDASFLNDPRMIRCFSYIVSVLTDNIEGNTSAGGKQKKRKSFYITEEELEKVVFPEGNIGINDFCRALNRVIDTTKLKGLNGAKLNKYLKSVGILKDIVDEEGHKRTAVKEESHKYGISTVRRNFSGVEYDQIVYSDEGKMFLLDIVKELYLKAGDAFSGDE